MRSPRSRRISLASPRRGVLALLLAAPLLLPGIASAQGGGTPPAPPKGPEKPADGQAPVAKPATGAEQDPLDKLVGVDESDAQAVAIIDRYLEAIGGKEALASIRDRVERFNNKKLTPTGETVMKMARYLARPVMIREDWELPPMGITKDNEPLTFVQVYDGEKGWVKTMGYVSTLVGKTLTVFVWDKHIDDFFASWRENGWTAKYVGEGEVGGRPVDTIELSSFAGNQKVRYSFTKDDGLAVNKTWTEGDGTTAVNKEVTFDEYLKIRFKDDPERWIRHATTHRIFEGGELALEKVYTEIVLNGGLPASTFARPEGEEYDPAAIQKKKEEEAAAAGAGEGTGETAKPAEPAKPVWEKPKPKPKPAPEPTPPAPPPGGGR